MELRLGAAADGCDDERPELLEAHGCGGAGPIRILAALTGSGCVHAYVVMVYVPHVHALGVAEMLGVWPYGLLARLVPRSSFVKCPRG